MKEGVTFYRFLSEVRAFLSKLIKEPIKAEPSKYLKDHDFGKSKLIKELMKRDVLERHEKILDSTNSDEKVAKYFVKYKVKKKDFENKVYKIYIKFFEKNEPEKKKIDESVFKNEEDMKKAILENPKDRETYQTRGGIKECEGGDIGGTSCDSVAAFTDNENLGYPTPMGVLRRSPKKEKEDSTKPENILGKTITAEGKKNKTIMITQEQYNMLMETDIASVASETSDGQLGPVRPGGISFKKKNGKADNSAYEREPGFSVRRLK